MQGFGEHTHKILSMFRKKLGDSKDSINLQTTIRYAVIKFSDSLGQLIRFVSFYMRKPAFCICENKGADQLCSNRTADQCLCFRFTNRTIPLLPKSEISSLSPFSVVVQPGLCQTWSETPKTGFLATRLKMVLTEP